MGSFLKGKYLKKISKKNNTMTLKVESKDSTFSINLAGNFVKYLDEYIRTDVQKDAKESVSYLEQQLISISDPLLREKIQSLIANEIEKEMVVSREAFRVVDPVYLSKAFKEKKLYPMVLGAGLLFMVCLWLVILHAFSNANKLPDDQKIIDKIKKELRLR